MNRITNDLYKKIVKVSDDVKNTLRKQGIAIPIENDDGTINVGHYTLLKTADGFYEILDYSGESVVGRINLPQTAIMIANDLALGKFIDKKIVQSDQQYGYALFEETLYKKAVERSSKKSIEYFDVVMTKCVISKAKKELHKQNIVRSFEKLRKLA